MSETGTLVRAKNGQFVRGNHSGGRPKGSKNAITISKLAVEEGFREANADDIQQVLAKVVAQALEGDKYSQKMVWDSAVSKQTLSEDKAAGSKQQITVHTMNVRKDDIEGDFVDITEDKEETLQ